MDTNTNSYECIVIGDGAAGLSAALQLGRARRRTLVVGAGHQSNLHAAGIGGLLGYDRRPPAELYSKGREELGAYPSVSFVADEVVSAARGEAGFRITLRGAGDQLAETVVLATGMDYAVPPFPGLAERWGHSVFHCPFCHGWEHREQPLAVLESGEPAVHRALLLRMWSDDVTLLARPDDLPSGAAERLTAAGVVIDSRPVESFEGEGIELNAVRFADGSSRPLHGLLVPAALGQRSSLARELGASPASGSRPEGPLAVDTWGATSVPGLFAAGDTTTDAPSVANAIASGARAAVSAVRHLSARLAA